MRDVCASSCTLYGWKRTVDKEESGPFAMPVEAVKPTKAWPVMLEVAIRLEMTASLLIQNYRVQLALQLNNASQDLSARLSTQKRSIAKRN